MSNFDKILCKALQISAFGLFLYFIFNLLQGEKKEGVWPVIILCWVISLLLQIPTKPNKKD